MTVRGLFEQALAAEKAAAEEVSTVSATGGAEASLRSNLTAHESIVGRKDRQVIATAMRVAILRMASSQIEGDDNRTDVCRHVYGSGVELCG